MGARFFWWGSSVGTGTRGCHSVEGKKGRSWERIATQEERRTEDPERIQGHASSVRNTVAATGSRSQQAGAHSQLGNVEGEIKWNYKPTS